MNFLTRCNTSGIPASIPSQQPQQAFTLVWCSGAHHLRWWVLSHTPPMGVCGKYSLTSFYGQLDHLSVLWPLGQATFYWPHPATNEPFGQLSTSPTPMPIPLFWAWVPSGLPGASGPLDPPLLLWALGPKCPFWAMVCGTLRPLLA
ncbi:hypothetical protein O181_034131 [Austropuccinia psidii MF-1]|uniref:Uncharacterized protein n=1 Tax=Austropuccinia psidii MF-1 TaxID=1389203 RepID=A0A9Q3D033_9BASI|nr:hypothetical protein [Austropuccinia psidii MF-1]